MKARLTDNVIRMLHSNVQRGDSPRAVFLHRPTNALVTRATRHPGYNELLYSREHVLVGVYDRTIPMPLLRDDIRATEQELVA